MRIEVRGRGLEVGPALSRYAERRALFAFGRFSPRIEGVTLRLSDTNGPRGGIDKECRLTARLRPSGALCVAEQDADMYAAPRAEADPGRDRPGLSGRASGESRRRDR